MKYTLRALLATTLLTGFYFLCLAVVAAVVAVAYVYDRFGGGLWRLGALGIFGIFLLYAVGTAVVASVRSARYEPIGMPLTPEAQPELWAWVRELANAVGTRPPDEIHLTAEANAGVVEESRLMGLVAGRRRMEIGAPLVLAMTRGRLTAVLGHELGHYSGRHTALGALTYRGSTALARAVHELGTGNVVGRLFNRYRLLYERVSHAVNRRQEIEADAVSAAFVGRDIAISALRDVEPIHAAWTTFLESYVHRAHRVGLRPAALAEGFLDFLDDPARRAELAELRDNPDPRPESVFDTHPPMAQRIARLATYPDDGRVDDGVPGFALLADPDETLAEFFGSLYDADSPLEAADWSRIGEAIGRRRAESGAGVLVRSMQSMPHLEERGVTLNDVASELRSGRGAEIAGRLLDEAGTGVRRELAGHLVGALLGVRLVDRGNAVYPLDWSGRWPLLTSEGHLVDVTAMGNRAVHGRAGVEEMLDLAVRHAIPLDEPLEFPEPEPDLSRPPEAVASLAPLWLGMHFMTVIPSTRGLAVIQCRGLRERLTAGSASFRGTSVDKLTALVLRVPFSEAVRRPGAELLAWDAIASVRLEDRRRRTDLVVTLLTGDTRRLHWLGTTDALGDPFGALHHFLGERFELPQGGR